MWEEEEEGRVDALETILSLLAGTCSTSPSVRTRRPLGLGAGAGAGLGTEAGAAVLSDLNATPAHQKISLIPTNFLTRYKLAHTFIRTKSKYIENFHPCIRFFILFLRLPSVNLGTNLQTFIHY